MLRPTGVTSEETADSEFFARRRVFVPGMPVFDAVGLWVGVVDYGLVRGGDLMMRPGWFARERLPVPIATIVRMDPDGIYLDTINTLPPAHV